MDSASQCCARLSRAKTRDLGTQAGPARPRLCGRGNGGEGPLARSTAAPKPHRHGDTAYPPSAASRRARSAEARARYAKVVEHNRRDIVSLPALISDLGRVVSEPEHAAQAVEIGGRDLGVQCELYDYPGRP